MGRPDLWDDADAAKALTGEYANVRDDLATYDALASQLDDAEVLHELAREEDDESQEPEIVESDRPGPARPRSARPAQPVHRRARRGRLHRPDQRQGRRRRRPGLVARCCCGCTSAGPSGAASTFGVDGVSEGTEAGILSAEFTLSGRYAYGLMTSERGTHRLVRISPFDNQGRRQTSFAAVQVWPMMDDADVAARRRRHPHGGLPGVRRRRPARQQDVVGGAPDPRADRPRRQLAGGAQPAAEPGEGARPAEGDVRGEGRGGAARPSSTPSAASRPRSAGAARSARTCCSRTRWSRTCAPTSSRATSAAVLDGDLDEFMEGWLRWRRAQGEDAG